MAGSDVSEGQAVWQPGGAEEDSRLHEGNRHLHLAYDEEEEEDPHPSFKAIPQPKSCNHYFSYFFSFHVLQALTGLWNF